MMEGLQKIFQLIAQGTRFSIHDILHAEDPIRIGKPSDMARQELLESIITTSIQEYLRQHTERVSKLIPWALNKAEQEVAADDADDDERSDDVMPIERQDFYHHFVRSETDRGRQEIVAHALLTEIKAMTDEVTNDEAKVSLAKKLFSE